MESCVCDKEITEDQVTDKLESLIGQTVYVKSQGRSGQVSGVAPNHRNSLIIQIGNRQTVAHIGDLSTQAPGPVRQTLDWINSVTGGGAIPPRKVQPASQVQQGLTPSTPDEFKRLAGIKR
jgi:hypothetical protein